MKSNSRVVPLAAAVLVTGCASFAPLPPEVVASAKRIGVVSQMGDTLYKQHVGFTVFGNERDPQNVAEWKLDSVFEEQLAASVRIAFGAEPVLLSSSRSDFKEVNDLTGPYSAQAFWGPNFDKIEEAGRRNCNNHALDGIVVAARWKASDPIALTNQPVEGVGVYSGRRNYVAHVFSKLGYFDCKSNKTLKVSIVLKPYGPNADTQVTRYLHTPIDSELAVKPFAEWTPEERTELAKTLTALSSAAWTSTLQEMITPRKPPRR